MKVAAARVAGFARRPDPATRVALVYGPDSGQVREVADQLTVAVAGAAQDPFRVTDLTAAGLKADPARLSDEVLAISLTGGRRVVRVRDADDTLAPTLKGLLAGAKADTLVVVTAGDLGPRSALRKLAEDTDAAAALPCYLDDGATLESVVADTLRQAGATADDDAIGYLTTRLGGDRLLTRREVEKLAVYAGSERITLAMAMACIGDSTDLSLDHLAFAAADGDHGSVDRMYTRLRREGVATIAILRSALRHFQRLHLAAGHLAAGRTMDQAMAALKPPVFFKLVGPFRTQLAAWPAARLARALDLLTQAEIDCKTTGLPDEAIAQRVLIQLTQVGAAGRRARARR